MPLALIALVLAFVPAFAHHPTGSATAACTGYNVSGSYVGGSSYRWVDWNVDVTIDGNLENISGSWNGVSPGFNIFTRTGSGPHDVTVSGYIKMFDNIHTNADTNIRTFDNSPDSQSGDHIFVNYGSSDNSITITTDGGYLITKVELDVDDDGHSGFWTYLTSSGVPSFVVNPNPGSEINNAKITVVRPASDAKGALMDTFDDWKSGIGKTFVFDDVNCVPDYQLNLSHIECVAEGAEAHFVLLNVPDGVTPGDYVEFTDGASIWQAPRGAHTGNVWHYTAILPDGYYNIVAATVDVDGYTVILHNPGDYAGDYNCVPDHEYTFELEQFNNCDRWERSIRLLDNGEPASEWIVVDGADWPWASNPYLDTGSVGAQTYTGEIDGHPYEVDFPAMDKAANEDGSACQQTHQVNWDWSYDGCEGITAWYWIDDGEPVAFFEHTWADPFTTESVDIPEFQVPTNEGELYSQATVGEITVDETEDCRENRPTSVELEQGICRWDGESSSTAVEFTLGEGVTVLVSGPDGFSQNLTASATLVLPPGGYSWYAVADEGYVIEGASEGQFAVGSCEPGVASADVTLGICEFDKEASTTEVTFTLSGDVTVTLTGPDGSETVLTETTTLLLLDGHYEWIAVAGEGSELKGEGSGAFDLDKCKPRNQPRCPTCGAPIRETDGESMGIAWFSDKPCDPRNPRCWYDYRDTVGGWVKLWTRIESFFTRKGETTPLTEVVAANGVTYYEYFFRDPHSEGDFILWGPDGYGDRFRDHVPDSERALHKYSACSIFPSWADTRLVDGQGYALWLPGHNVSDWAQFLLDNGFFPDEEHRGTAALAWAADLRTNGNDALMTWDGDLNSLPLFPLPPR
jgi:hypothetical protein